jgi:hypothetical protein
LLKPSKLLRRLSNPNSGFLALLAVVQRIKSCFINGFINFMSLSLTPMTYGIQVRKNKNDLPTLPLPAGRFSAKKVLHRF